MAGETDPHRSYRFQIDINGRALMWFSDVSGFDLDALPGAANDSYDAPPVRRLPGRYKLGNVTLRKGVTSSEDVLAWVRGVREGKIERRSFTITAFDAEGVETGVWQVNNAWPTRYSASGAPGGTDEVQIDMLDFAHEGIIRSR